jgi:Ribosomal protein L11 methyltransferase (PrmA)
VSIELDAHRRFVGDRPRLSALARAIDAVVRPGDVVIDLASGTGILGLLACRAGAARVYCIEAGAIVGLARAVASANGFQDRMRFVHAHSSVAQLPERADVLVTDQIGQFGFEAGLVEIVADVRARLLKPGARIIPHGVTLCVALVESKELRSATAFWADRPAGFEFEPASRIAMNSGHRIRLKEENLIGSPAAGTRIDLPTVIDLPFGFSTTLTATRSGLLDGIGGWFVADLSDGVTITNAPGASERIDRSNVMFPVQTPVALRAGDTVQVSMRIRASDLLVQWTVSVPDGRQFSHSTLGGMFILREDLERTNPSFSPRLTGRGEARRTVLELCDGRSLQAIEREVYDRHRDLFATEAAAHVFVAEVVTRYCV